MPSAARGVRWTLVVLAAIAVTAVAYAPLVAHPNSTVLDEPNDLSSSARDFWAAGYQHKTMFTMATDRLLDPPGRPASPAVQIANAIQPLFVGAVHRLTGDLGAFNLFLLVGIVASLVAMYALLTSLGMHPVAAAAGAIAFGFCPMSTEQLLAGHAGFAQLWVFPLLLWTLLWARRGRPVRAAAPGLALAVSFYAFSYLGLLCSLVVAAFLLAVAWEQRSFRFDLRRLAYGAGATAAGLLPAALAPRIAPSSQLGLPHLSAQDLHGAALRDFFLPSSRHPLYGGAVRDLVGRHIGDHVEFFGYATLGLAAVAVVMLVRRSLAPTLPLRFGVLLVPLGWWAALPAAESAFGARLRVPDPASIVGELTSWWRVYARFGAVAGFGLVLLASAALDRLLRSGRTSHVLAASAAVAVMVFEALPGLPVPTYRFHVDGPTAFLRGHPGGAVAVYPIGHDDSGKGLDNWIRMYWASYYLQVYHHHPILSSDLPGSDRTVRSVARALLVNLTNKDTPSILRAEGIRWVVLHRDVLAASGLPQPRLPAGLELAARFPGVDVFRVIAPPSSLAELVQRRQRAIARVIAVGAAQVTYTRGFYPREDYGRYTQSHWMRQDGNVIVTLPGLIVPYVVYEVRMSVFSSGVPRTVEMFQDSRPIAKFSVPTGAVLVKKLVRFPNEKSTLTFHATPGPAPLAPTDPRVASVYFVVIVVRPVGLKLTG